MDEFCDLRIPHGSTVEKDPGRSCAPTAVGPSCQSVPAKIFSRQNVEVLEGIMEQFWHICIAAGGVGVVLALALRFALGK